MSDDTLDGCAVPVGDAVTADDELDALVLFADVEFDDPAEVARRVADYEELFGAS